jgi:hypothetical protein
MFHSSKLMNHWHLSSAQAVTACCEQLVKESQQELEDLWKCHGNWQETTTSLVGGLEPWNFMTFHMLGMV